MATTIAPWYTQDGGVYHIRDDCGQWKRSGENKIQGTADRKVCIDCLVLLIKEIAQGKS